MLTRCRYNPSQWWQPKCPQRLPNVPMGANLPLAEMLLENAHNHTFLIAVTIQTFFTSQSQSQGSEITCGGSSASSESVCSYFPDLLAAIPAVSHFHGVSCSLWDKWGAGRDLWENALKDEMKPSVKQTFFYFWLPQMLILSAFPTAITGNPQSLIFILSIFKSAHS